MSVKLTEDEIKKKIQVFTPVKYAEVMATLLLEESCTVQGKTILDNSCGTGNLLIEVARIIIKNLLKQNESSSIILAVLEKTIHGFDVDQIMVDRAKTNLNALLMEYSLPKINWHIECKDFLSISSEEKYDFIISNPPYLAYRDMTDKQRSFLSKSFNSCSFGKFDYYYAFIEKSLIQLKPNGMMVFIVPNNLFKTISGEKIRDKIKPHLVRIIDFKNEKVFTKEQVQTSSAIIVLNNIKSEEQFLYSVGETEPIVLEKNRLSKKWLFSNENCNQGIPFGTLFDVHQSIATLRNEVFIQDKIPDIEKELVYPTTSPKDERRGKKRLIIVPYKKNGCSYKRISDNELRQDYPKAYSFLEQYKKILLESDKDKGSAWYEYGRSQGLPNMWKRKLLISPIISSAIKIYEIDNNTIPYSGIVITQKGDTQSLPLSKAKEILSSASFLDYCKDIGIDINGHSLRITTNDVKAFKLDSALLKKHF